MATVRFLAVLISVSLFSAISLCPAFAQSAEPANSGRNTNSNSSASDTGQRPESGNPFSQAESPDDRIFLDDYMDNYKVQRLPHLLATPQNQDQLDAVCYTVRNFRVARDDAHSDATHPDGYSTCQLSTRFRVKSIDSSPELLRR
ncbi:MAG TPA: hypothetical protein VI386_01220 [Candidatus Sulfotelmatobacter sp.]